MGHPEGHCSPALPPKERKRRRTQTPPGTARLTVICFSGMKSALCLTRSKILARWGLMKASSGGTRERAEGGPLRRRGTGQEPAAAAPSLPQRGLLGEAALPAPHTGGLRSETTRRGPNATPQAQPQSPPCVLAASAHLAHGWGEAPEGPRPETGRHTRGQPHPALSPPPPTGALGGPVQRRPGVQRPRTHPAT